MVADEQRYVIQSAAKALELLKVFSVQEPELNLTELSRRLGLGAASTLRAVATLQACGFLEQNPVNRKYRLGLVCLELGSIFLSHSDIRQHALPGLRRLRDEFRETVHLAKLAGSDVVYLEKLEGLLPIGLRGSSVGGRAQAHSTALGKVMLAYLPAESVYALYEGKPLQARTPHTITNLDDLLADLARIRERGYSLDNEENDLGAICVGAPLFDHTDVPAAAISCSGPADRMRAALERGALPTRLLETARAVSARLGATNESVRATTRASRGGKA